MCRQENNGISHLDHTLSIRNHGIAFSAGNIFPGRTIPDQWNWTYMNGSPAGKREDCFITQDTQEEHA